MRPNRFDTLLLARTALVSRDEILASLRTALIDGGFGVRVPVFARIRDVVDAAGTAHWVFALGTTSPRRTLHWSPLAGALGFPHTALVRGDDGRELFRGGVPGEWAEIASEGATDEEGSEHPSAIATGLARFHGGVSRGVLHELVANGPSWLLLDPDTDADADAPCEVGSHRALFDYLDARIEKPLVFERPALPARALALDGWIAAAIHARWPRLRRAAATEAIRHGGLRIPPETLEALLTKGVRGLEDLGSAMLDTGDLEDAVAVLSADLAIRPQSETGRFNRACGHARLGRTQAMLDDLRADFHLYPDDRALAAKDSAFRAYRGTPAFDALVGLAPPASKPVAPPSAPSSSSTRVSPRTRTRSVAWTASGDLDVPYTAMVDGRRWDVRLNDFPAEPLYTLMIDGEPVEDLDAWPGAWTR